MPIPKSGRANSPVQPSTSIRNGSQYVRSSGTSTKIAHSPYTTLGIAASSSVRNERPPRSAFGHISVRKTATPTASGTAITSATIDGHDRSVDERQRAEVVGSPDPTR